MAITILEYNILMRLREMGVLPPHPDILELGEQNWYEDIAAEGIANKIRELGDPTEEGTLAEDIMEAERILKTSPTRAERLVGSFRMAKIFYKFVFNYRSYTAIDFHGTEEAIKHDLNEPLSYENEFDVVTNIGTAEHVFFAGEVFRSMHRATRVGGIMIHTAPMTGWWDHGFYSFQPTLYYDLAQANGYTPLIVTLASLDPPKIVALESRKHFLELVKSGAIETHTAMLVALRKETDAPFKHPMQGVYFGKADKDMAEAWKKAR